MTENEIAAIVVDACIKIHTKLGPGLFENVYEAILARELENRGLEVERQVPIPVTWDELVFDEGCRADLIIEDKLIIELKSVEKNLPVHKKQLNTYLKLSGKKLGLVANFGMALMRDGIARVVNGLEEGG